MGLRPRSIPAALGLSAFGGSIEDAEQRYESDLGRAPLLGESTLPRQVSLIGKLAACGGHFLGWFGGAWFSFSCMLMLPAAGSIAGLGLFPVAFVGLFIVIGLVLLGLAVWRGLAAVRLVQRGALTWAVVTDTQRKVSTSRDSDGHTTTSVSYDVSFMYRTPDGELRFGEVNLQRPDKVVDEPCELMLYDPDDPGQVEFADLLPGGLRIDSQGNASESRKHNLIGLIPWLILPIGPILGTLILLSFQMG